MNVRNIIFRREQDGPVEREFKRRLIRCFSLNSPVTLAFLARVSYQGAEQENVALCLKDGNEMASKIALCVGEVFRAMFSQTQNLDILFLEDYQVKEIMAVATPFYQSVKA